MEVRRDRWGIPHVTGATVLDVARSQGRASATDRGDQLVLDRWRGEGRSAELLGRAGVEWDRFARRALLDDTGRRAYEAASAETRAFVAAYAEGVSAALPPGAEPWHPWTPATLFLTHHVLFATFPGKLWRHHAEEVLGADAASLFCTEGPASGSNAYAVAGGRTATGLPIVAGDPHRGFEDPNVYAQVRLTCPEFDVVGFAFAGVPGVQHFAHAGAVAWAITNAVADYQDLYLETPATTAGARRHTETIRVRDGEPVEVEVVLTDRGPVVLDLPDGSGGWSLRTPSLVTGELGLDAWLPLLRARTADDVDRAFDRWVEPVNNVVVADTAGEVRHRVAGRVPVRRDELRRLPGRASDGHGWTGWVEDLPRTEVGADGYVVTANDRASAAYDAIGVDFAPPHRARRIAELLEAQPALDEAAAARVLADVRQTAGGSLLDRIGRLDVGSPASPGSPVVERLSRWDREMSADSADAALFVAVRTGLVEGICAAPPLRRLAAVASYGDLLAPWFDVPSRVAASLETLLAHDSALGVDLDRVLLAALEEAGHGDDEPWGGRHRFAALSRLRGAAAPAVPLAGDTHCVLATGWLPGSGESPRGPVARYVWSLAGRGSSGWVVPLGASGDPSSPHHHDQQAVWACGAVVAVE